MPIASGSTNLNEIYFDHLGGGGCNSGEKHDCKVSPQVVPFPALGNLHGQDYSMSKASHWEQVYHSKPVDSVSWFQPHADRSLGLIQGTGLKPEEARIIDVGAGASRLVDDLLDAGYRHLSVLDIAEPALAVSRTRLGERADGVDWRVGDITRIELPAEGFDIWHDRAVFHFLTDPDDRQRYVSKVWKAVRPGGFVIVATFGPNGPLQCSNLDVCRYSPEALHGEFGSGYELVGHSTELHTTPAGKSQEFVYCYCRRSN